MVGRRNALAVAALAIQTFLPCAALPALQVGKVLPWVGGMKPGPFRPRITRLVSFRFAPESSMEASAEPPAVEQQRPLFDDYTRSLMAMLIKSMCGSAMLVYANGVGGFTNFRWMWLPASVVVVLFGLMSAYTYTLVALCCNEVQVSTYTDLWAKTISASSAWIPTTACALFSAISCQIYMIILRDTLMQFANYFIRVLPWPRLLLARGTHLAALGAVLLPLCLLRSLSSLARVSQLGMVGVLYVASFASWRCITGAYAPGGQFASASAAPMFGSRFSAIRVLPFLSLLHGNYQGSHPTRIFVCVPRVRALGPFARHASFRLMLALKRAGHYGTI